MEANCAVTSGLQFLFDGEGLPPATPELTITEHRLHLADSPSWQFLRLSQPTPAVAFQVLIDEVYPGEHNDDVAIAEVRYPLLAEDLAVPSNLPYTAGATSVGWLVALIGGLLLLAGWGMRIRSPTRAHSGERCQPALVRTEAWMRCSPD